MHRQRHAFIHFCAGIPLVWLGVVFIVPLLISVVFSFGTNTFGGITFGFTLDNYRTALSGLYLAVLARTIAFAAGASFTCLVVAYPVAYFIAGRTGWQRTLCLVLILLPYFSSFLIRVMSLQILFSRDNILDAWLQRLHFATGPLDLINTPVAVLVGMVYAYLPIATVPIFLVLERIPPALRDASRDLGASYWQRFLTVTFPLSLPGVVTSALLTIVPMLGELVIPQLLGGGRGVLMGQIISSQYLQAQNYPLGASMAVILMLIVGVLLHLSWWLGRRLEGRVR
ncbi:MAG: ABC transporter permease [Pseudomonadota bacterium]